MQQRASETNPPPCYITAFYVYCSLFSLVNFMKMMMAIIFISCHLLKSVMFAVLDSVKMAIGTGLK